MSEEIKSLNKADPLKRQTEVNAADMGEGLSPMSPPDAFEPPAEDSVPYAELDPFLQALVDDHNDIKEQMVGLKKAIATIGRKRVAEQAELKIIADFLSFFHLEFIPHNRKEESHLFRILNQKLLESGEHSQGGELFTGIKVLEDDHDQAISLGGTITTLVKLHEAITDPMSKSIVLGQVLHLGAELVELLELHIFREDNIIFGLAQKLLSSKDWEQISKETL